MCGASTAGEQRGGFVRTLTLTFDRALDTTATPAATRFTVAGTDSDTTVNGVAFKSGDARSIELTLSAAVSAGDTGITLSYAAGDDTNPLQGSDGRQVANFSGQPVANTTPDTTPSTASLSSTVNGSTIRLVFDEPVKGAATEAHFVVEVNNAHHRSVNQVELSFTADTFGDSITITLDEPVAADDQVRVGFQHTNEQTPFTGVIADASGNGVENDTYWILQNVTRTAAPMLSGVTLDGTGTTLTLTSDKNLNTTSVPGRRSPGRG